MLRGVTYTRRRGSPDERLEVLEAPVPSPSLAVSLPPNTAPWPDGYEPTAFQRDVVEAVQALRTGELITYGELAEELGRPGGGQAVANVPRCAPGLPWWRVLPAEGRLYRTQAPLLQAEGHHVDDDRRVHPA